MITHKKYSKLLERRKIKKYQEIINKTRRACFKSMIKFDIVFDSPNMKVVETLVNSFSSNVLHGQLGSLIDSIGSNPEPALDWNPFSQRLVLNELPEIPNDLAEKYMLLRHVTQMYQSFFHELMHVVLWEPFFVGSIEGKLNKKRFVELSLAFEGFCFFFSDIWLMDSLDEVGPFGEPVLYRSGISNRYFNCKKIFNIAEIRKSSDILKCYVRGFLGRDYAIKRLGKNRNSASELFTNKMYGFFKVYQKELGSLYDELGKIGVFSKFYKRFCCREGLPVLMKTTTLAKVNGSSIENYCESVFRKEFKSFKSVDNGTINEVFCRRLIQTRAYFAYQVLYILDNSLFIGSITKEELEWAKSTILEYLDGLEVALDSLAKGRGRQVQRDVNSLDKKYEKCRKLFRRKDMWVGQRSFIVPIRVLSKIDAVNNIWTVNSRYNSKILYTELVKFFMQVFETESEAFSLRTQQRFLKDFHVNFLNKNQFRLNQQNFKVLLDKRVLRNWSVPLEAIDPINNQFKEMLFVFE